MPDQFIVVEGARQNNLKNLKLRLPLNKLIVITGVSGSGKSSLAFDTIYSEGQRRYVETFSPYARQFLDRMDRPQVNRIEGIPPAIAIDQTNPVRTSRSTVGTMTELNDHIKLLFARAAQLYCRGCGRPITRDSPMSIYKQLLALTSTLTTPGGSSPATTPMGLITFEVAIPNNFSEAELVALLERQGYTRIHSKHGAVLEVVQDRVRLDESQRDRIIEGLEAALKHGRGQVNIYPLDQQANVGEGWRFSADLHCPDCDIHYRDPVPNLFSFNSPIGACETCRGFGRIIGIDYGLVVPDETRTLAEGAIRPWQTDSYRECQNDLMRFARRHGVRIHTPWRELSEQERRWVFEGEGEWEEGVWYGVRRFFKWLETKNYKMHIRVLLSKYRTYTLCPDCKGARLKPEALIFRLGTQADADQVLERERRFRPASIELPEERYSSLPGLCIHDVMLLPIERCYDFFNRLHLPTPLDEATELLIGEIRSRLRYLVEVGLGYLTLDRQSRTLSGGEVQRINLTTALGTSLVNTLLVLDEPSIGLHARDIQRVIEVLHRLRDAGNSLIVVEHDPQTIVAADRVLDLGPGPGEQGGEVVFYGTPKELLRSKHSLTARYLSSLLKDGSSPPPSPRTSLFPPPSPSPFQGEGEGGGIPSPHTGAKTRVRDGREHSPQASTPYLEILGAAEHNLKDLDLRIPLQRLVCITGVSGSGKSTLLEDICYKALCKLKGKPVETPGRHRAIRGHEWIREVILVDQSLIGKTTRSNPASYVGALDAIRRIFAAQPLARERGYTASTFSFNGGQGRCPTCGGNGFERVEMQFLSDVYLRCPDCDGRRYQPEVLEVKLLPPAKGYGNKLTRAPQARAQAKSIADVLDMTVSQAMEFFSRYPEVVQALKPLAGVGLGYIRLGQPVSTLSGGEAQRLKLAGHLARGCKPSASLRGDQKEKGVLFLFDEPTTGLHFDDIATLLKAFQGLLQEGHSLVVIEHNLEVIRAADWIIDLGPEGGEAGGELVCAGTPHDIAQCERSYTGIALRQLLFSSPAPCREEKARGASLPQGDRSHPQLAVECPNRFIHIHHAREHNLKNIEVRIPRDRFTVITGISGSGKSTLAFDILFAEGQRRYLESLNAYARQFVQPASRPDVDAILGIPPTVAIEQRTSRGGFKSTVATLTEIYHFLRLLFVKLGTQHCPDCGLVIESQTLEAILAKILRQFRGRQVNLFAPLVVARKGYYTDLAKWAAGKGFSHLRVDGTLTPTVKWPRLDRFKEHTIELPIGNIVVAPETGAELRALLSCALDLGKGVVHLVISPPPVAEGSPHPLWVPSLRAERVRNLEVGVPSIALDSSHRLPRAMNHMNISTPAGDQAEAMFSTRRSCPRCSRSFPELDPRLFSFNSKHGWCERCFGTGLLLSGSDEEQSEEKIGWNPWKAREEGRGEYPSLRSEVRGEGTGKYPSLRSEDGPKQVCPACKGQRLRPEALAVRFQGRTIAELTTMSVADAERWFQTMRLHGREAEIARDILPEIQARLRFLKEVGLSYLTLDRTIPTLSGGEAQRIRLASQLGSNLRGVCYVLDEPTIGLHARDNHKLLRMLHKLKAKGNTVVVVEHDEETIRQAEHVIDLGPGAGTNGGWVVAEGPVDTLLANPQSATGRFLASPLRHPLMERRRTVLSGDGTEPACPVIEIIGACLHNLKDLRVSIPLGRLVCVTGVSGSGKSTLVREVLHHNLQRLLKQKGSHQNPTALQGCAEIRGWEMVRHVLEVDQSPIGKTPRSCPATYVGLWDYIRRLFAETPQARMQGYSPGRFSFNVHGGRCPVCEGQGVKRIEMSFLPDVEVICEACGGARFTPETLAVRFKEKTIAEVLAMSVDEAAEFFTSHPPISHALQLLQEVGLGYLTLGQRSPTLSGGEAQRIKLVTELAKARPTPSGAIPRSNQGIAQHALGRGHSLYVLDEPTVGLHMADIEKLIRVLHRLVAAGNTVVVIEHNLDVIAEADWVIDLGPEGGNRGGHIVAQGPPEEVSRVRHGSYTAKVLAGLLKQRGLSHPP